RSDAGGLLHQRVVDGDRRHRLVVLARDLRDFRRGFFQLTTKQRDAPDEDAGVPRVVAGAQELLRFLAGGFLRETLEANDARRDLISELQVTVAGVRLRRLDA